MLTKYMELEFVPGKIGKCEMIIQTVYMFKLLTDNRFSRRCF